MSSASSAEATVPASVPAAPGRLTAAARRDADTIVVGLGNPLLGDDGIGWRIVETVRDRVAPGAPAAGGAGGSCGMEPPAAPGATGEAAGRAVRFECLAVGGLALMERLVGFGRAILVDAMLTGIDPPGTVRRLRLADLPGREASHLDSAHDASLSVALAAGRALGADLPDEIEIVAIEALRVHDFSEELTPAVAASLPAAIDMVLDVLGISPAPAGSPGTA